MGDKYFWLANVLEVPYPSEVLNIVWSLVFKARQVMTFDIIHPIHLMSFVGHCSGLVSLFLSCLVYAKEGSAHQEKSLWTLLLCPEGCTGRIRCTRGPKVGRPDRVCSLRINLLDEGTFFRIYGNTIRNLWISENMQLSSFSSSQKVPTKALA